jgi:hypothetical protein
MTKEKEKGSENEGNKIKKIDKGSKKVGKQKKEERRKEKYYQYKIR